METENQAKLLAELVRLLAPEKLPKQLVGENVISNVFSNVLSRLDKLENQVAANQFLIGNSVMLHPSQQKFQIAEANEILLPHTNEKACRFEPDKPCDYCSMCSSHGF